jgi:molybdopterin/thiamine biosynthesis adenylyltransferase
VDIDLSDSERERYSARIDRDELGIEGQVRLRAARAIVIGAGRRGATAAGMLASSGVGYVAVVDGATVALADLGAQLLQYTPDVGSNKAESVAAKLGVLNPLVQVESYPVPVDDANAAAIVDGHDVALDCTGDPATWAILEAVCADRPIGLMRVSGDPPSPVAAGAELAERALLLLAAHSAEVRA